jgi:hypothetical protein
LTLVVVPVVYTIFDDIGNGIRNRLTRGERQHKAKERALGRPA